MEYVARNPQHAGGALGGATGFAEIKCLATAGIDSEPQCFLRYKLERPIIKSWSIDASDDDRPSESVSILYNKIFMLATTPNLKRIGRGRFELPTSCSQSTRATWLRYRPQADSVAHRVQARA